MLPVGGIGVSFGIVIETELEATAREDHVCRATVFVARGLWQTVISANGADYSFLLMTMV